MEKYFQENIISTTISVFSVLVALAALILNRKSAKRNSYNQKACYYVFFIKKKTLACIRKKYDFMTKVHNSAHSREIPFDYSLIVSPYIGGIYRTQIFSILDCEYPIGINKTGPVVLKRKPSKKYLLKKYASESEWSFTLTPLFPYFSAYGMDDIEHIKYDKQLNRYHFYLEITDFCQNTEIWYISFSLLLSNIRSTKRRWKKCSYDDNYKYYLFDDINIVSPKDIPKNLERINKFDKTLSEILDNKENSIESITLNQKGFEQINHDLQIFEMKEYVKFLEKLNIKYNLDM